MRRYLAFALFFAVFGLAVGAEEVEVGDVVVRLRCGDGYLKLKPKCCPFGRFKDWNFIDVYRVRARAGEPFAVVIENRLSAPVGVYVFVDGKNTIGGSCRGGGWWYVPPGGVAEISSWRDDDGKRLRFARRTSCAHGEDYMPGWIFVAQYRLASPAEGMPRWYRSYGYDQPVQFWAVPAESLAVPITEPVYRLEPYPQGLLAIRYVTGASCRKCRIDFGIEGVKAARGGVYVLRVKPGSPADRAGFVEGDVILAVDGKPVNTPEELEEALSAAAARGEAELKVRSATDGRLYAVSVKLSCAER